MKSVRIILDLRGELWRVQRRVFFFWWKTLEVTPTESHALAIVSRIKHPVVRYF